jgi:hypothetical protein
MKGWASPCNVVMLFRNHSCREADTMNRYSSPLAQPAVTVKGPPLKLAGKRLTAIGMSRHESCWIIPRQPRIEP